MTTKHRTGPGEGAAARVRTSNWLRHEEAEPQVSTSQGSTAPDFILGSNLFD
jgi:hypothetical protein